MRPWIALLCLPVSIACTAPVQEPACETYELLLSPGLSPEWEAASRWADAKWTAAVPTFQHTTAVGDGQGRRCTVTVREEVPDLDSSAGDAQVWRDMNERPTMAVLRAEPGWNPSEEHLRSVMLHELGHVIAGPEHEPLGTDSAMRGLVWLPARIGCIDQRKACTQWGCASTCKGGWLE